MVAVFLLLIIVLVWSIFAQSNNRTEYMHQPWHSATSFMRNLLILLLQCSWLFWISCADDHQKSATPIQKTGVYAHPSVLSFTEQLANKPKDAALYYQRALALRSIGEDSVALLDFYQATELDSSQSKYFSAIGELLFEHKDVEGSVKWFKKAIEIDPMDPVAHLKFAKMLIFVNDNEKAFKEINTVLRRDPYNAEGYFLKGMVYKNMNDTNKSISSFQTAVQVDPGYQPAILQLAMIYAARKDDLALRYFDNAYKADTHQMVALHAKAMYLQDKKSTDLAKTVYREILTKDSNYIDAAFNLSWLLMQEDSLLVAEDLLSRVLQLQDDYVEAYYNRGVCRELLQKKESALSDYQRAVQLDPQYPEARAAVGRLKP